MVSVMKEMVRVACRRWERVVIPLLPPQLSTALLQLSISLPYWFAWQAEKSGGSGAGLIDRAAPAAGSIVLVLTALMATKSQ
jgi:hypothetical protein